jgi:CO/xanthine dehydrogenase Mo-binding subunit
MADSYKREAMEIHLHLGADSNGCLRAAHADVLTDSGAYASMTPLSSWRASMHAAGCYRYEAATTETNVVYTNNGYSGAFRGFGNPQACAAVEMAIDELASKLGRDPIELRLQNVLHKGDRAFTGNIIEHDVHVGHCLEWVRKASDWDRKRAQFAAQPEEQEVRRGLGVACYFHGSGLGGEGLDYANASIRIESDYSLTLQHGMTDYGQGSRTIFTLLAAEVIGITPDRIHMLRPDTQTAIESGPTVASRTTLVGGNAVKVTAQKLAQTLLLAAADLLGCSPEEVRCQAGRYISQNENDVVFEQVVDRAREMGLPLSAQGYWQLPEIHWNFETGAGVPYYMYCYGAQVAEVEGT